MNEQHIKDVIYNYITLHNINNGNIVDIIKRETYPVFFNDLTTGFIGLPNFTYDDRKTSSEPSLIYMADAVADHLVRKITEISVDQLFLVSTLSDDIEYNYPNFKELISTLLALRKNLKTEFTNTNSLVRDSINVAQLLIKYYLNTVYGVMDNPLSVLSSKNNNARHIIVDRSKRIILSIVEFLVKNNHPVFYIDTDVVYTDELSVHDRHLLVKFVKTSFEGLIESRYLNLSFDYDNLAGYFIGRKKFIVGKHLQTKGLWEVQPDNIIKSNKIYFGKEFPDIFPEYSF